MTTPHQRNSAYVRFVRWQHPVHDKNGDLVLLGLGILLTAIALTLIWLA